MADPLTPDDRAAMRTWWHARYIGRVRADHPELTEGHDLAVGWKISRPDGTTHGGYWWPAVHRDHWEARPPVLHQSPAWDDTNHKSCPSRVGDGLCVLTHDGTSHATSGGIRLTECVGHAIVYPRDLARSNEAGKLRVPWCVDVDTFSPLEMIRQGWVANLVGAYLRVANLRDAYLVGADLRDAYLMGANLGGADLRDANLVGAHLRVANLGDANLVGADLRSAYLRDARLRGAVGVPAWLAERVDPTTGRVR